MNPEVLNLINLLAQIDDRRMMVPIFQRGFVWKADDIKKLLVSMLLGYPIGVPLVWRAQNAELGARSIQSIHIEDADDENNVVEQNEIFAGNANQRDFILDGQQRLTSIYLIFPNMLLPSPNEIEYKLDGVRFFFNLENLYLFDPDYDNNSFANNDLTPELIDNAIIMLKYHGNGYAKLHREVFQVGVNAQNLTEAQYIQATTSRYLWGITRGFLNFTDNAISQSVLAAATPKWITQIAERYPDKTDGERSQLLQNRSTAWLNWFNGRIRTRLTATQITRMAIQGGSIAMLPRIFETINTAGMSLNLFDLLVAKLGVWQDDNCNITIRELIKQKLGDDLLKRFDKTKDLGGIASSQLPKIFGLCSLVDNQQPTMSQTDILSRSSAQYLNDRERCVIGLQRALTFLKDRMSIKDQRMLPFKDIITLAGAIFANNLNADEQLLEAYLWGAIFTLDLTNHTNNKICNYFTYWDNATFESIRNNLEQNFPNFDEVATENSSSSVLYNGVLLFVYHNVVKNHGDDFGTALNKLDLYQTEYENLEDHHIFPRAWLSANLRNQFNDNADFKEHTNSVWQRVLVTKEANREVGADAPCQYLQVNNFHRSQNIKLLCIPETFSNPVPQTRDAFIQLLRDRYGLIKQAVIARIAELNDAGNQ